MPVTVEYLHLCDYAFVGEGGKTGLIGIFENINASGFPTTVRMFCVALRLQGTAHEKVRLHIELGLPNGDVLTALDPEIALDNGGGANLHLNFANVTFPEAGRYTVKVSAAGQTLVSHSLRLQKIQALGQDPPRPH